MGHAWRLHNSIHRSLLSPYNCVYYYDVHLWILNLQCSELTENVNIELAHYRDWPGMGEVNLIKYIVFFFYYYSF